MGQTERILSVDSKNAISEALNQSISELVVTTMMAQNFHWNVTGMAFGPLHELFQKIYEDHFEAQDELAERIKAIGGHANGVLGKMVADSKVLESDGKISDKEMKNFRMSLSLMVARIIRNSMNLVGIDVPEKM